MEDLKDMKLLMNLTSQGQTDEAGMRLLGILLARLNKSTLRENMSQTEWDELTKVFGYVGILVLFWSYQSEIDVPRLSQ